MFHPQPFLFPNTNNIPTIPSEIEIYVEQCEPVKRLSDPRYPEGVFFDNTKIHTLRLVATVQILHLPRNIAKDTLTRMLWIHDLPEGMTHIERDYTSVEKSENQQLDRDVKKTEDEIAKSILSDMDLELYQAFEKAGLLLKGKRIPSELCFLEQIGLIAKILDTIDGNMGFHYFLSRWAQSKDFNENKLPPESALAYTFHYVSKTRQVLTALPYVDHNVQICCLKLLDQQLEFVFQCWKGVNATPDVISSYMVV